MRQSAVGQGVAASGYFAPFNAIDDIWRG